MKVLAGFGDLVIVVIFSIFGMMIDGGLIIRYYGFRLIRKDPGPFYRVADIFDH